MLSSKKYSESEKEDYFFFTKKSYLWLLGNEDGTTGIYGMSFDEFKKASFNVVNYFSYIDSLIGDDEYKDFQLYVMNDCPRRRE